MDTTVLLIIAAMLATLALIFYALHKIKPNSFRLRASLLRLFSLELEMDNSNAKPSKRSTKD